MTGVLRRADYDATLVAMTDGIHTFAVQCIGCGKLPQQNPSKADLRDQLKTGKEITLHCSNCYRSWPADHGTRGLVARQLGVKDWR